MSKLTDDFIYGVCAAVNEIPRGYVSTYGQIAKLIGCEKNARLVGTALKYSNYSCPWHRVVNCQGKVTSLKQKQLLQEEGITFNGDLVAMKKHKWSI